MLLVSGDLANMLKLIGVIHIQLCKFKSNMIPSKSSVSVHAVPDRRSERKWIILPATYCSQIYSVQLNTQPKITKCCKSLREFPLLYDSVRAAVSASNFPNNFRHYILSLLISERYYDKRLLFCKRVTD